jgi:glyoxylase-like metal-dependent hydrolase (beta-lactamase superfamily II)
MVQEWNAGDVSVRKLAEFEFTFAGGKPGTIVPAASPEELARIPWLYPEFVRPDGMMNGSIHSFLVETPDARIIVDTCVGNGKRRSIPAYNMIETSFIRDFEQMGWTRETVTHVICTHLHFDHVGWNTTFVDGEWVPTFPNARYVFTRKDLEYYTGAPDETAKAVVADSLAPVVDAGLVTLVEMDAQIVREIRLRPSPGHSPGHVSCVIESAGKRAVISGDVMHHPCQVAHPQWSSVLDVDQDRARTARAAFLEEFADSALVLGTHFASPTAGRIVRTPGGYIFDTQRQAVERTIR